MPNINDINGVTVANLAKLDAVLKANISTVNGLTLAAAFTGLLDTYTGAAAGYSTRRLASSATNLLRIREDVGDTETDIGYDSNGDLDTAAIASHCGSANGYVVTWYDQSGNANNATQSTSGSQPQIYNGTAVITENGKPALSFSTDTFDFTITGNANNFSSFTVATNDATTSSHMQFALSISPRWWHWYQSGNAQFWYGNTSITHSAYDQSQHLSTMIAGSTLGHAGFWIDNVKASTTATLNTSAFDGSEKIGDYPTGGNPWDGTMQEIVLWPSDQSSNRTGIETDINSDYLIYQPTDAPTSGLLATYTGAAAAYSVRQLSDKAVIALRIRRDSDDEERNIGFDSNGDLATADISAFCGTANGYVVEWADQSTNGNHATQSVANEQPQIYNGTAVITENGKAAVQFDGINHQLLTASYPFTGLNISIFSVVKTTDTVTGMNPYSFGDASNIFSLTFNRSTSSSWAVGQSTSTTQYRQGDSYNQAQSLFSQFNTGTTTSGYRNGTQGTQNYLVFGAFSQSVIGSRYNQQYLDGTIQEVILWDVDQDGAGNRTGIESNIDTYFQIP